MGCCVGAPAPDSLGSRRGEEALSCRSRPGQCGRPGSGCPVGSRTSLPHRHPHSVRAPEHPGPRPSRSREVSSGPRSRRLRLPAWRRPLRAPAGRTSPGGSLCPGAEAQRGAIGQAPGGRTEDTPSGFPALEVFRFRGLAAPRPRARGDGAAPAQLRARRRDGRGVAPGRTGRLAGCSRPGGIWGCAGGSWTPTGLRSCPAIAPLSPTLWAARAPGSGSVPRGLLLGGPGRRDPRREAERLGDSRCLHPTWQSGPSTPGVGGPVRNRGALRPVKKMICYIHPPTPVFPPAANLTQSLWGSSIPREGSRTPLSTPGEAGSGGGHWR